MTFEKLTQNIATGLVHSKDYTDWAESLLSDGEQSENIAILASLGLDKHPDNYDVKFYFERSINDLGLFIKDTDELRIDCAESLCNELLRNEISSATLINQLDRFFTESDYEPIFSIWSELSEDIWLLDDCGHSIFNSELTTDNKEEYIKKIAEQFIQLIHIDLPKSFFRQSICKSCCHLGETTSVRADKKWLSDKIYQLFYRQPAYYKSICTQCQSSETLSMSDFNGRKLYLKNKY
ncbi:hypothetical protein PQO03_11490 [Lentisphaera profundi]|uniref:Uncharacterized protein n=1 Tax=Lentisphaera profundi TaxID=1658616 RepID=A0ABY7VQP6_9BACT|nr:hypothetical protein [Lentisphaera profundi]WDE96332.1 hypothetical protein PQO03_11490 [Lentisphaera profundi]